MMLSFAFIHVFKGAKKTLNVQLKKLYCECVNMKSLSLSQRTMISQGRSQDFLEGGGPHHVKRRYSPVSPLEC